MKSKNRLIDMFLRIKNSKVIPIIILLVIFAAAIIFIITSCGKFTPVIDSDTRAFANIFSVIFAAICALIWLASTIFSQRMYRYDSIKDEVASSRIDTPDDKHSVLSVLNTTDNDYFVLALFYKTNEIRPAIYTKRKRKVTPIDLHTKTTHFKKIRLIDSDESDKAKDISIRRIRNKATKSQMIFFASDNSNLKIRINNQLVPKLDCNGKIGRFSVYGITEECNAACHAVNIDGNDYMLTETTVEFYFINKKEI